MPADPHTAKGENRMDEFSAAPELDLFAEELPRELPELTVEELPAELSLAASTLATFTSLSSFTCPGSSLGTFSTASSIA